MKRDWIMRWLAIVLAALAAVSIAVWTGMQNRLEQPAEPVAEPIDTARQVCAQRLADVGRALAAYAEDYEGAYPLTSTPAATYDELLPLLEPHGISAQQLLCPTSAAVGGPPYVYHSYLSRGGVDWPKWMPDQHVVTSASSPDTWLLADALERGKPGPHSETQKAFNYLRADGSVKFHQGQPRAVYR